MQEQQQPQANNNETTVQMEILNEPEEDLTTKFQNVRLYDIIKSKAYQ